MNMNINLDLNPPNSANRDNTRQETNETFHTKSVFGATKLQSV